MKKEQSAGRRRKGPLFRRYFLFTALMVMLALVMLGGTMIVFTASQWWTERTDALLENAHSIVAAIRTDDPDRFLSGGPDMDDFIDNLKIVSSATGSDFFLTDNDGRVIACKEAGRLNKLDDCVYHAGLQITENYMLRAIRSGFRDYINDEVFGSGKFVIAVPVMIQQTPIGVLFGVEDAITGLLPYVLSILKTVFFAMLISLLLCIIIIYIFTRGITEPLAEMEEVTKHFAKGEFQHRANENYKCGYLSEFAVALNQMADELAVEEEAQRSFIANVSHELKTPMTSIGGFIDGILDGTIPKEQETQYLRTVSKEIRRLSRIVVSMLNLSKIEAGEVDLAPVKYDISAQLFETLLPFERTINDKDIQVEGFENMRPVSVTADRDLIQQVIYNLLDNAVKFTPEHGIIRVESAQTDHGVRVSIRNSGAGVSSEEIARIFERFYKVDKSRSFDVKGVGLGLYIVKTIINMHDGTIRATSKEGEYTEFSFELPD